MERRIIRLYLQAHVRLVMLPGRPRRRLIRAVSVASQADLERDDRRADCDTREIHATHVGRHVAGDARGLSPVRIVAIRALDVPVIDDGRFDGIVDEGRILDAVRRELIDARHDVFAGDVAIVANRAVLFLILVSEQPWSPGDRMRRVAAIAGVVGNIEVVTVGPGIRLLSVPGVHGQAVRGLEPAVLPVALGAYLRADI